MTLPKEPPGCRFHNGCLFCKEDSPSSNYICQCSAEEWKNQYRAYDLRLSCDAPGREGVQSSFRDYNFEHPEGMLQYTALPGRSYRKEGGLQVGLTPLFYLRNLRPHFGTRIFIKSEGHNPSGCFKDRETLMCLLNSRRKGLARAVIYSSGNAAASAAIFAQKNDLHLITFVSGDTYDEKINFIRAHGSDVVVIGDEHTNFETGYRLFAQINALNYFFRAGYDNWSVGNPYRVQGDKTTAVEIIKQLSTNGDRPEVPDFVVVPTANGSCLAGVWKGFKELYRLGIIPGLPRMVSAGIKNANPVYKAVKESQLDRPMRCDLSLVADEDADIGSIILAEEGYDSIEAAKAVVESGGLAVEVTKVDIEATYHLFLTEERELAQDENILPEPASVVSIAAIEKIKEQDLLKPDHSVVSVITGSGFKARGKIKEIMAGDPESLSMVDDILDRKIKGQYPKAEKGGQRISVSPNAEAVRQAFDQLKIQST